jgi:hypothetical protein
MQPVVFLCGRWVGTPGQPPQQQQHEAWIELLPDQLPPATKRYALTVATSDIKGAGTDVRVALHIFGAGGQALGPLSLDRPGAFERGQQDQFSVQGPDVGRIARIRVSTDGSGVRPGWHLGSVTIEVLSASASAGGGGSAASEPEAVYHFPCSAWLDQQHGTSRELLPGAAGGAAAPGCCYTLTLHTSDLRGAGTDANIDVNIVGQGGAATGWQRLQAAQDAFERGKVGGGKCTWHALVGGVLRSQCQTCLLAGCLRVWPPWVLLQVDSFRLAGLPDVGQVARLVVRSDGHGQEPAWHLHKAVLLQEAPAAADAVSSATSGCEPGDTDPAASSRRYFFTAKRWLDHVYGWQVELQAQQSDSDGELQPCRLCLQTSDIRGAGTDATVFATLIGERGQASGPHQLTAPLPGASGASGGGTSGPFERGSWDEFQIMCPPLGQPQRLRLWTDRPGGPGSGAWHLDFALLRGPTAGEEWYFVHRGWVSKEQAAELLPSREDPRAGMEAYEVVLRTSDVRGAGTDSQVGKAGWGLQVQVG